jgi:hypothetical protein
MLLLVLRIQLRLRIELRLQCCPELRLWWLIERLAITKTVFA